MTHANGLRGEVIAMLGGLPRRLCLTLGALAELETAFDVPGWDALAERLRHPSARDICLILAALLRAAGEGDLDVHHFHLHDAIEAVAAAFAAAGPVT